VWIRKQRILLRVIKRHAFADRAYYELNRARLDAHLAHLHRAVAVPLLLSRPRGRRISFGRRERAYLAGGVRFGRRDWPLWLLSYSPPLVRRLGVSMVEKVRKARTRTGRERR
jgi:hypothetical protein